MDRHHVYLLDFDNTLFDTEKLRSILAQRASEATGGRLSTQEFFGAYEELKTAGYLDLSKITSYFVGQFQLPQSEAKKIFLEAPFSGCLFPDAIPLLRRLGEKAYIYSLGDSGGYQWAKIRGSGILEGIPEDRIIVSQDKNDRIPRLLERFKADGVTKITIADDKGQVIDTAIEAADKLDLLIEPIHFAYGKYKDAPLRYRERTVVVSSLAELSQRLVGPRTEGGTGIGVEAQA